MLSQKLASDLGPKPIISSQKEDRKRVGLSSTYGVFGFNKKRLEEAKEIKMIKMGKVKKPKKVKEKVKKIFKKKLKSSKIWPKEVK